MFVNKLIGGIIALVSGIFLLIPLMFHPLVGIEFTFLALQLGAFLNLVFWVIALLVTLFAIFAGIGMISARKEGGETSKRGGAILAIIIGIVVIVMLLLPWMIPTSPAVGTLAVYFLGTSELYLHMNLVATIWISLEAILLIIGGIIAIPGK